MREPSIAPRLVVRIVAELRPVAETSKASSSKRDLPAANRCRRCGDPHEIRRAIANLVANAIEATPRGGHVSPRASANGSPIAIRRGRRRIRRSRGAPRRALSAFRRRPARRGNAGSGSTSFAGSPKSTAEASSYAPRRTAREQRSRLTLPMATSDDGRTPERIRVVIVEDHALTRAGLRTALETSFDVVGRGGRRRRRAGRRSFASGPTSP